MGLFLAEQQAAALLEIDTLCKCSIRSLSSIFAALYIPSAPMCLDGLLVFENASTHHLKQSSKGVREPFHSMASLFLCSRSFVKTPGLQDAPLLKIFRFLVFFKNSSVSLPHWILVNACCLYLDSVVAPESTFINH